jgi:hypothetical protein
MWSSREHRLLQRGFPSHISRANLYLEMSSGNARVRRRDSKWGMLRTFSRCRRLFIPAEKMKDGVTSRRRLWIISILVVVFVVAPTENGRTEYSAKYLHDRYASVTEIPPLEFVEAGMKRSVLPSAPHPRRRSPSSRMAFRGKFRVWVNFYFPPWANLVESYIFARGVC